MSHLGRPDGHKVEKYSLKPVVRLHPLSHPIRIPLITSIDPEIAGRQALRASQQARHLPARLCRQGDRGGRQEQQGRRDLFARELAIPRRGGG